MSRIFRPRTLALALILVVLAALTFGFAAQNTVAPSKAGIGDGTVSGYGVGVSWDIDDSDPSLTTQVTLDFGSDEPNEVWAAIGTDTTGPADCATYSFGGWINCSESGSTATCTYAGDVEEVCAIRVSAGD